LGDGGSHGVVAGDWDIIAADDVTTSGPKTPTAGSTEVEFRPTEEAAARVDALLTSLETTANGSERARILLEIALVIRDGLKDDAQALDALLEAWRADPTLAQVLDHLEPLARAQNRWAEVVDMTRTLVAGEVVPERALAYTEAIVRWLTRELPTPDLASEYLERVRLIDPTNWLLHLVQAAKYRERGDVKGELEELDRAVSSAKRADDRARIHLLMAHTYADDPTPNLIEAKRHFSAAHKLMPQSMEALVGLEKIHLDEHDLPALAEVLEREVEASDVEAERVTLLLRLADIYEKQFLKPDMAAEKFEHVFALDPSKAEVLAGLERCYTAMRSWDDLVRVLEGAIDLVDDPQERAERLLALTEVYESKVGDLAGALKAYERLEKLLPDDETLVGELARLSEKTGDWQAAARYRSNLAELTSDPRTRARMHVMAGQLLAPHDRDAARAHFDQAVTFDPANGAAWNALLSDARQSGDMARLAGLLEGRAGATEGPRAQSQVYAELGTVKRALGDEAGAVLAWESAIARDPNNETAARPLLDRYVASERWQDAALLCDLVLFAAERDGDLERLFVARRHACAIAIHIGKPGRALAMAQSSFDMRKGDAAVKQTLIECAWILRADPQVLDALEAIEGMADDLASLQALSPATRAQLGEVLAVTGERERATMVFEDVLRQEPGHAAALRGLAGLRAASGESIAAWTLNRQLAQTLPNENERLQMLLETADGFATKANRPDLAAEVYEEARLIRPNDHALLHKLLAQYQAMEDWRRVFNILVAIVECDDDPSRKAKVVMTMGQIAHGNLDDWVMAVELYDEAMDLDPSRFDAFERIARILTEVEDWPMLSRAYERTIARAIARGDARLQHSLRHQLGLLYRDRLGDTHAAIASIRAAAELMPDDEEDQAILRDLLMASGQAEQAVALTVDRVRREPLDPAPYRTLYDLLAELGYEDRAWCTASVMAHLGVSHPAATAFHRTSPPPAIEQIPGTLGPDGYKRLLHPDLDPTLTVIFEVMAAAAVEVHVAQLGLRERLAHPGPALTEPEFLIQDVKGISGILGVAQPRLFTAKMPPAIGVGVTRPPSLLIHPDSLPGVPREVLAFWIGKRLAELTPPLLARALFRSVSELKELVAAAVRIVQEKGDKLSRSDEMWRTHVRKERRRDLSAAIERALEAGGSLDVRRWFQLADLSSSRIGLVIAGDVETARLALVREGQSPGDLALRDQMRELVAFFLSEDYAHVRSALGVSLA
jgi:tetratricopeptide (TPR) repeat protein